MSSLTQVTDATFKQEVLESELPGLSGFLGTLVRALSDGGSSGGGSS
jgi:hypothetical protein